MVDDMGDRAEAEALLRELGLNQYEASVYMSLYRTSPMTASDISDDSGVPKGRVYDVLQSLESKGLVFSSPSRGKANLFLLAPHVESLESLRDRRVHELEEEKTKISHAHGQLIEALSSILRKQGDIFGEEEALAVVHGSTARDYYMKTMLEKVEKHVTMSLTAQQLERYGDEIRGAKSRGVQFTFMVSPSDSSQLADMFTGSKVYAIPTEGPESQVMRLLGPVRPPLMILDDKVCVLFLYNSDDGLVIRSPELISQAKFVMEYLVGLVGKAP